MFKSCHNTGVPQGSVLGPSILNIYNLIGPYYCWYHHKTAMMTGYLNARQEQLHKCLTQYFYSLFSSLYFSLFLYLSVLSCMVLILLSVIERISLPCVNWSLSVSVHNSISMNRKRSLVWRGFWLALMIYVYTNYIRLHTNRSSEETDPVIKISSCYQNKNTWWLT